MFDVSIWEVVLVGIVALVVLGPERLPSAVQRVGRILSEARALLTKTRAEIEQALIEQHQPKE
ncbi:MAG: Sec-independent protein translocase protein TatB [Pseudomonadota bacterium]|nr:Sec-independent protein translocase protein TatB [Pseudomonadota bacterium]